MLSSLFRKLVNLSPKLSIKLWQFFYEITALKFNKMQEWRYMNYGYAELNIERDYDLNSLSENLYRHLFEQSELKDKDILEVGCGRGGGCELALQYQPKSITGLDFSRNVIRFCQKYIKRDQLNFVKGNAENLQFLKGYFDVILNLESSHCYGNRIKFFTEVYSKLKPGGFFLYADFIGSIHFKKRPEQLINCGFKVISCKEITPNVLYAMNLSTPYKENIIKKVVPKFIRKPVYDFVGLPGSDIYNNFQSNKTTYFSIICQKPIPTII